MSVLEVCPWCKNPNKLNDMKCGYCDFPIGYKYAGELTPTERTLLHPFSPSHALWLCWKDHFLKHELCTWCGSSGKPKGGNCPTCNHNETPEQYRERRRSYCHE